MDELQTRCLDTFPQWLRALGKDASEIAKLLDDPQLADHQDAQRYIAASLNYLFKSLDLIPDGIEDLGFLDDAFVLRVGCALAVADAPALKEKAPLMGRLAGEAKLVEDLLERDYGRLEKYVRGLTKGAARGRTVDEIVDDKSVRGAFLTEVSGWAASYAPPSFSRDEKNLVKLQSFLSAKLPT